MSGERKVWVATLNAGCDLPAGAQVMIEQFGDEPPTIAVRADRWESWGPPRHTEAVE